MAPPVVETREAGAWYRQPVAWLGLAIFLASVAGCIALMVLGADHAHEQPLATEAGVVFGVPLRAAAAETENRERLPDHPVASAGRARMRP
ncbi:MAG: hypothetical protein KUL75_01930 [Sterolibacterium sp.]|nr:hypothetical protein [Sterolibacterium sp.]